ncbi:MAG: hypothetical protein A2017_19345 [Lentisphaerae bacterium GWF2_44_16]|nr:MAG: hypothetical protein A2017_19345 [Lentisphaerae bacterium GWF2_44_16]
MDYILLDSGNKKKLEQIGPYRLVRPAQNAVWKPVLSEAEWAGVNGIFERDSTGGGRWKWLRGGVAPSWNVDLDFFNMLVKPTDFGHLGFFPEQYSNWQWLKKNVSGFGAQPKVLNLFAYSGASSLAAASAGANVCHVDAAKGMVDWAKENLKLNSEIPERIRWITDDVIKFVNREIRRGSLYNGIILDPPSFGRGSQGQVWKLEDDIMPFLELCGQIIDKKSPYFVIISCHSQGFSPSVLSRLLCDVFSSKGEIQSGEMLINEKNGREFAAGSYSRLLCR